MKSRYLLVLLWWALATSSVKGGEVSLTRRRDNVRGQNQQHLRRLGESAGGISNDDHGKDTMTKGMMHQGGSGMTMMTMHGMMMHKGTTGMKSKKGTDSLAAAKSKAAKSKANGKSTKGSSSKRSKGNESKARSRSMMKGATKGSSASDEMNSPASKAAKSRAPKGIKGSGSKGGYQIDGNAAGKKGGIKGSKGKMTTANEGDLMAGASKGKSNSKKARKSKSGSGRMSAKVKGNMMAKSKGGGIISKKVMNSSKSKSVTSGNKTMSKPGNLRSKLSQSGDSFEEENIPMHTSDEELPPVACTADVFECPDGSFVGRAGPHCEFELCPEEPEETEEEAPVVACTMELQICPDGSSVGRTGPDCEFEPCPPSEPESEEDGVPPSDRESADDTTMISVACTDDVFECPDGSFVGRGGPDCMFELCPEEPAAEVDDTSSSPGGVPCTLEAKICPDGSSVGRTGPDCEFEPCPPSEPESSEDVAATSEPESEEDESPAPVACTLEVQACPDGTTVGRTGPDCEFEPCPTTLGPVACTLEVLTCPDGTTVGRTGPDCEFEPCPDDVGHGCTDDVFECPDGSFVAREGPDCEFEDCPEEEVVETTSAPTATAVDILTDSPTQGEVDVTSVPATSAPTEAPVTVVVDVTFAPETSAPTEAPVTEEVEDTIVPETNAPRATDEPIVVSESPSATPPETDGPLVDTESPDTESPATTTPATDGPIVDTESPATTPPTADEPVLLPKNDDCLSAAMIELGLDYFGSTTDAEFEDVQGCGSTVGGVSAGLWYSIVGTGSKFEVEVNASYSMQLSVFEGDCNELICIDGTVGDAESLPSGSISWEAEREIVYYLYINGQQGETGDFALMVTEGDSLSDEDISTDAPTDPDIETSIPVTSAPTASGSLEEDGGVVGDSNTESPDTESPATTPPATDGPIVDTESPETTPPATDEPIIVSESPSATPQATDGPLVDTESPATTTPATDGPVVATTPPTADEPDVVNDECLSAAMIDLGLDYFGSTTDAEFEDVQGCGSTVGGVSAGLWYSIVGTGAGLKVDVNASFGMQLSIFEGDCAELACVDGIAGDVESFPSGSIRWDSESDVVYYIYINGQEGETGDFSLMVMEEGIIVSDEVTITAAPTDDPGTGTSIPATSAPTVSGSLGDQFPSDEVIITAAPTDPASIPATSAPTASGSLVDPTDPDTVTRIPGTSAPTAGGSLEGPDGEEDDVEVATEAPEDPTDNDSEGEEEDPATDLNDDCVDAIELEVGDIVPGTTASANEDDDSGGCTIGVDYLFPEAEDGASIERRGVWYSIEATDTRLRASVCSGSAEGQPPFAVTVYAGGDDCTDLACAPVYNTAGCAAEWVASSDFEMYFILVESLSLEGSDNGSDLSFEMTITEVVGPRNDECQGAIELELGDTVVWRVLSASEDEFEGKCALQLQPPNPNTLIPGVWYSVLGDGGSLSASTCNEATEEGPILVTIYSGSCNNLQCETADVTGDPCRAQLASTEEDERYYIYVEKVLLGNAEGVFELTVDS